jgi:DNA repair exonuclease SbcCD nuclease subunit
MIELNNFIAVGDLHLLKKQGMWENRSEIADDDLYALAQATDLCLDKKADMLLLGDMLDTPTTLPRPMTALLNSARMLEKAGLRMYYIQGQHDFVVQSAFENDPWMALIPGAIRLSGQKFKVWGKQAYAMDYFPQAMEMLAMSKIPKGTEVLFMHGTVDVAFPMNPHFQMANIPSSVELILAGDYHRPGEHKLPSGGSLWYTGSPWMTAISESAQPRRVLYAYSNAIGVPQVESIELATRSVFWYSKLDGSMEPLKERRADLPEAIRKPIIVVDQQLQREQYAELAQVAHVYTSYSGTPDMLAAELISTKDDMSNEEILEQYVDKINEHETFSFVLDVINSPVDDAISRLKEHMGVEMETDKAVQKKEVSVETL